MAPRRSLLIVPPLLALAGWAATRTGAATSRACGGCHAPHFAEVGSCSTCHRGDPRALRREIGHQRLLTGRAATHSRPGAPAVAEGRRLLERLGCRRCHVVGGEGSGLATDLDRVAWRREQAELTRSISLPVENMPRFGLDAGQVDSVIALLLHVADPRRAEPNYRVRFAAPGAKAGSVFERSCGGCHRALTRGGSLGRGSAGPNLSGLVSPFYPVPAGGEEGWAEGRLSRWLANPRAERALATMRPVRLEPAELRRLLDELSVPPRGTDGAPGTPEPL